MTYKVTVQEKEIPIISNKLSKPNDSNSVASVD